MTQARGEFVIEFDRYEEVPMNISEKIIEDLKKKIKFLIIKNKVNIKLFFVKIY